MSTQEKSKNQFPNSQAVNLDALLDYVEGSVVSRTVIKKDVGTVTMFAFDVGEGLSEHTAPYDALIQILDGQAELTIGGKNIKAKGGEAVLMPANVPHSVHAAERFKMLLVMVRA